MSSFLDPESEPTLVTFSDGNEECYGCVAALSKGEVVKNELSGATFAEDLGPAEHQPGLQQVCPLPRQQNRPGYDQKGLV